MSGGNRCEICNGLVKGERARHKQTRYCGACAKAKKKENSLSSWTPEEKRRYMRRYMRAYRRSHPGLSSPYVRKHRQKKGKDSAAASSNERPTLPPHATVDREATYIHCLAWFLPLLLAVSLSVETMDSGFEVIKTAITHLELLIVKVTGLLIIVVICLRHVTHILEG